MIEAEIDRIFLFYQNRKRCLLRRGHPIIDKR